MKKLVALFLVLTLCIVQTPMAALATTAVQTQSADAYVPTGLTIYNESYDTETTLQIGQRIQLWTDLQPYGAVSGIVWSSSDPLVVSVDTAGRVTALRTGTVQITATTYNGIQDTFQIFVPQSLSDLTYEQTADGTGYEIVGADTNAYTAHIPATYQGLPVVAIHPGAFKDCANLRYFTVDDAQQTFYADGGVVFTNTPEKTLVCFPPAYDAQDYYYVPQDTVAVASYAFAGLRKLKTLTMQEGLQKLGDCALAELKGSMGYYGGLFLYMPASLTEIGANILQGATRSSAIYAPEGAPILTYTAENQIPSAYIADFQGDPTTVTLGAPTAITGGDLVAFNGDVRFYTGAAQNGYSSYKVGVIYTQVDLSELQQDYAGEVRAVLSHVWNLLAPDPNGNTAISFQPQTGLYGAGYTEGEAILRGYDREGNLIAMQHISGDFSFSFPGAYDLGVEGGQNTHFTVLPVEPVFVASAGTYSLESLQWHQDTKGEYFRYFVLQMPNAIFTQQFSMDLNLLSWQWIEAKNGGSGYVVMKIVLNDKSRAEAMNAVSLVFDAMACIYEDEHVKCMISSLLTPAERFGQQASELAQLVKTTMLGTYVPAGMPVHQILIDSSASWTPTASEGNIQLTKWEITEFSTEVLAHEMVHTVDQNLPNCDIAPSAWMEGRAEYIGAIICGRTGTPAAFDWSILTEAEKADFFQFYCYGVNRYTTYPVGHWFFHYLIETYGTEASVAIMDNIRNLQLIGDNQAEQHLQFKACVEQATAEGVFQHFVCEVINATGHTPMVAPAVTPSCTESGLTEGSSCSFCGKVLLAQQVVEATGHSYDENDICVTCGQPRVEHHHTVEVFATPTTEVEGSLYLSCDVTGCTQIGYITLPVLNATDYTYEVVTPPTVSAEGLVRYTWKNTDYGTFSFEVPLEKLNPQIVIQSDDGVAGETLRLELRLVNNPGVAGLVLTLEYDTSVFELLTVENGTLLAELDQGINLSWNMDGDCTQDGLLCTLEFQIAEDAPEGTYAISARFREACDYELEDVVFTVVPGQVEVRDFVYGDADGNGVVNGKDVILLRKFMANYDYDASVSTVAVSAGADANGDGVVNGKDVILLRKFMANYDYDTGESTVVLGPQN